VIIDQRRLSSHLAIASFLPMQPTLLGNDLAGGTFRQQPPEIVPTGPLGETSGGCVTAEAETGKAARDDVFFVIDAFIDTI